MKKYEQMMTATAAFSFCMFIAVTAFSRDPLPADMRGAADMRSQMESQMKEAARAASAVTGREMMGDMAPATTPEKEMERRRNLINGAHKDFMNIKADARATGGDGVASASSGSLRDISEPPRAVAVEGRVVIEGGQADAKAPRDQQVGVRYSIEERFVGNLVIATVDPEEDDDDLEGAVKRGNLRPDERGSASAGGKRDVELAGSGVRNAGGVLAKDYQIDTVSTGVRVASLSGGACLRSDGGRDADCVEQDPFTKSKVSDENKYGKFNDGVVAAQRDGNKIKIEVSAPDVSFSTVRGKGKASVGCSSAVFEMKASEFKQMVDSGSMTLTKQVGDADKASSGCRAGSTITLYMKVKGK